MAKARRELPSRARTLVLAMAAGGVAAIALRVPEVRRWGLQDLVGLAIVLVGTAVAEQFQVRVRHGSEGQDYSLSDAIWLAGLLLTTPSVLTLGAVGGLVSSQLLSPRRADKFLFNLGQFVLSLTAAEAVFHSQQHLVVDDPKTWLAAIGAMAAFFVVNSMAVIAIIALAGRKPFRSIMGTSFGLDVVNWMGNVAVGILLAIMWRKHPYGLPLLIVPLAMSYSAYRAWVRGISERNRMRKLFEAARALLAPLDASEFGSFFQSAKELFDAEDVELLLISDQQVLVESDRGRAVLPVPRDGSIGDPEGLVRARPGMAHETARIGDAGRPLGLLVARREAPFTDSERSLLATLASQVTARLVNVRLFSEQLEQRTQLAEIIAHTSDGIFVVSPSGVILTWNPGMERITGFPSSEAVGRTLEQRLGAHLRGEVLWPAVVGPGVGVRSSDVPVFRKDGRQRWLRYAANPMPAAAGRSPATWWWPGTSPPSWRPNS